MHGNQATSTHMRQQVTSGELLLIRSTLTPCLRVHHCHGVKGISVVVGRKLHLLVACGGWLCVGGSKAIEMKTCTL